MTIDSRSSPLSMVMTHAHDTTHTIYLYITDKTIGSSRTFIIHLVYTYIHPSMLLS